MLGPGYSTVQCVIEPPAGAASIDVYGPGDPKRRAPLRHEAIWTPAIGERLVQDLAPNSYLIRVTTTDGQILEGTFYVDAHSAASTSIDIRGIMPVRPRVATMLKTAAKTVVHGFIRRDDEPLGWTETDSVAARARFDGCCLNAHDGADGKPDLCLLVEPKRFTDLRSDASFADTMLAGRRSLLAGGRPRDLLGDAADTLSHEGRLRRMFLEHVLVGPPTGARVDAGVVEGLAESALQAKMRDPYTASAAAYYLLHVRAFERLHDWTKNLAAWFDESSDTHVIRATHLLDDEDAGSRSDALAELLAAARIGLPLYTPGLRLLVQGLLRLRHDDADVGPAAATALTPIRPYAAACTWRTLTTSFYGRGPNEPIGVDLAQAPGPFD